MKGTVTAVVRSAVIVWKSKCWALSRQRCSIHLKGNDSLSTVIVATHCHKQKKVFIPSRTQIVYHRFAFYLSF